MKIFHLAKEQISSKRMVLLLLATATITRGLVAYLQIIYGIQGAHWFVLTKWSDFYALYAKDFSSLNNGLLPYLNFGYWYPPLFLYFLYIFYLLGGVHLSSIPILAADAATSPLVYLLVSTTSAKRVALVAGLLYAFSPVALFIEGYLWLSSQPMTFFLLLSLYLLRKDRPLFSSLALALSILFKQEAIFILPVYVFWCFTKCKASLWKGITIIAGIMLSVSLPFLILSPARYFNDITYGSLGVLSAGPNLVSSTVSIASSIIGPTAQLCTPILPKIHTGTFITCGMTYYFGKPAFEYVAFTRLIWIAELAILPIFVLCSIALFLSRKRSNILELSAALSMIGFLLLFSLRVHSLLVYYFIPVYALLFASARGKSTIIILIVTSVLSVLTPDESYVPALLALLAITAIAGTKDTPNNLSIPPVTEAKEPTSLL